MDNEIQELEEVKESLRKQGYKNLLIDLGIEDQWAKKKRGA